MNEEFGQTNTRKKGGRIATEFVKDPLEKLPNNFDIINR
jgi:hypothetical protein